VNPQLSKSIGAIILSPISIKTLFLYLTVILFFTPAVSAGETFIYIEKKPALWIFPHDPVYQAWYKHADLIKLANLMQQSGKEQLALFTKTALTQMAIMYEYEAIKSRQENTSGAGKNFQKSRWRHTALEYAQQLQQVSEQVSQTSDIVLYIEEYGEPTIVIDGKPYILTTPDLKKSGLLYTAIVEDLCRKGICLQNDETEEIENNKLRIVINAEWKIAAGAPPEYFSEDGLHFIFNDLKDRKKKQKICLQIMRELRLISESLMEISSKGISIDWDVFEIELISGSYGHKIIINRFGDSLAMELIYLGQMEMLLNETIPWMQGQMKGETYQQRFDHADELISKVLN
jgi:hypothetical protein